MHKNAVMRIYDILKSIAVWSIEPLTDETLHRLTKFKEMVAEFEETDNSPLWLYHSYELWRKKIKREVRRLTRD